MKYLQAISRFKVHINEFLYLNSLRNTFTSNYCLIMVNSESMDPSIATKLWDNFNVKICADGGANRLYDGLLPEKRGLYLPDFIIGDLDSMRDDVEEYYK